MFLGLRLISNLMSIVVVGSVAYDDLETPFGCKTKVLGAAASHFSLSASFFNQVRLVGVVGHDFGDDPIQLFQKHKIDLAGLQVDPQGKTFYWKAAYGLDLNDAKTLEVQL